MVATGQLAGSPLYMDGTFKEARGVEGLMEYLQSKSISTPA
jgi:hypothetical protein